MNRFTEEERASLKKQALRLKSEGFNKKQISERIGFSQSTVDRWIGGTMDDAWRRHRLRRVSLADIPTRTRLRAAREICSEELDEAERIEILLAACFPSNKRYWIVGPREELAA